jgi:gas vesicle protein
MVAGEKVMRRHHASTTAEVVSFSAGALVGAGLALLYAPKSGHETREKVSDMTSNAFSKMKGVGEEAQQKLNRKLEQGREYAEEKASQFSSSNAKDVESYH